MSFGIPVRNGLGVGLLASTFLSSLRIGGRPAMFLNFIGTNSLDSRVTFTRATTATFVGSNGLIQTAAIDAPRFDYDPVTLAPKGLLIEEARTNLVLYSAQFDNAAWVTLNATVTANATTAPDGTSTADFIVPDTTNNQHGVYQSTVAALGTTYTHSVYAKAGGYNWLYMTEGNNVTAQASFNLANGTLGTVSGTGSPSATITAVGNGWYRCTLTLTPILTAQNMQCRPANADGGGAYIGNGTSGIFVWGANLEAGAFATSYIPTTLLAVTRNADNASMTGTNFSSWYSQTQGTFVFVGTSFTIPAFSYFLLANDGSFSNRFGLYSSASSVAGFIVSSGATQMEITASPLVVNVPFKMAVAAQSNDGNFSFNGSIGTTDTTITMPAVDRLSIGAGFVGAGEYINGHIRQIAYYNTRLPNTTLQALTA